jgi:hypothetical protein
MTNLYRPVSDRAQALYGSDDLELDLSPSEESDALSAGHLELVPRPYKVLVNNYAEGGQGDTVDLALPVENEAALVSGGILERAEKKKPAAKKSAK